MKGSGGSKMPHSHSTPAGVDGGSRTPPTTPRKAGKMLAVRVQMLDDTITMFQVQAKALGRVLFDQVCKQLHLLEADYFGLEYQEPNGTKYWLDLEKPVCRQVGLSLIDPLLRFCVKFYTPDPAQLEEEFTRYLFCLQIKRDLAQGLLQCNDNTAALMASYIVQAECGDYVIEDYPDHTYLSTYKFVPHQDQELERRIMENHKKHAGQSPAEADLNLLETARRCELYGMKMHPAKDHEGVPLNLAVAHMGIVVFQNFTKINTFSWAKIRKISFKRKRFLIKLHPEGYGYYKDTVEFFFEGRNECKNFWKKCVENHGFFRCSVVKRVMRQKTRVLSRGSSFRYSGKTQKQIVEFVRDNYVKRQTFQRSNSFRQTSGGRALQGLEGGGYRGATPSSSLMGSSSISAHPLLPLGDPALETPALSLSCGSMTLDSPTTVTSVSMGGTIHRREDTATSFRTLTSIDVHSPATPSQVQAPRQMLVTSHQRISSAGRISPSNSSPPEFPPPRPMPRHPWQRSASCRELYASSFEDSGKARSKDEKPINAAGETVLLEPFRLPSQGELDNPVTRYDESNRSYSAASSKLPSLDHDSVPERVYSSSYPGTSSLSTESGHEESGPAGDLSHDDLSHDSYELLEREHEFEYPESYSNGDGEDEPISDRSDEGIEREMFQMDAETDSFVKHRTIKSAEKQQFKSVLADLKNATRTKSIDRYTTVTAELDATDYVTVESRIQRSSTQIERKFETRHANSVVEPPPPPPPPQQPVLQGSPLPQQISNLLHLPHQDSERKDPVVLQIQKQKMCVLNELKNLKPKYKITHVDSEVLRDEGIMRPKSRIDDDSSPVESSNRTIADRRVRTVRARSIASLEDHVPRTYVETGSLGRGLRNREKKGRDSDAKLERSLSKLQEKERRRSMDRGDSREYVKKTDKFGGMPGETRERRRSIERFDYREHRRADGHGRRSIDRIDLRELRRSIERLDVRERSYERLDSKERSPHELRRKSFERLDSQGLRTSNEYLNRSPKERHRCSESREHRERSIERLDSREKRRSPGSRSNTVDYNQRHTLERFDSGNRSPFERSTAKEQRGRSVERLDAAERPTFDFDPVTIERLESLERCNSRDRAQDRRSEMRSGERKSIERLDSRERRHLERTESRERGKHAENTRAGRSLECLEHEIYEWRRSSVEKIEAKDAKRSKVAAARSEKGKLEEKPRERDDWRSLEKARKDEEKRERERQSRLSLESRTETVIGVPLEMENLKSNKTVFTEYEPKIVGGVVLGFDDTIPGHTPVERTKSDPNPARQRLGSNSKRHILMHQKSIDLTPADSGDEDPFSDSAAIQKANIEIPYTLHKRHVMNGTASDEKSESDSGKTTKKPPPAVVVARELPKLPLKLIADVTSFDLSKLTSIEKPGSKLSPEKPGNKLSPEKPKSTTISPTRPKSILISPSEKQKSIPSPTSKLSPTDTAMAKTILCSLSPTSRSPSKPSSKAPSPDKKSSRSASFDRSCVVESSPGDRRPTPSPKLSPIEPNVTIVTAIERRSPKVSPTDPNVTIVSVIQKRKSPDSNKVLGIAQRSLDSRTKPRNFADVVGMEMKMKLERKAKSEVEKDSLKMPDDSLEKQDSIEKIPLPEIPAPILPNAEMERIEDTGNEQPTMEPVVATTTTTSLPSGKPKVPEKPKNLEKLSIPEKTKRILEKIESKFSEANKCSSTRIAKPKIIDTGFDDFVDPVADLPLDEVPVKPALELDSLKVPEFVPFASRPHGEPLRSKSLSLAEEKAPIDTLLSPEVENKHFVPDVSPKRAKKVRSETKKDFKKQSKSLEGDKPPLKKAASKESRMPATSTKIDKSKLKLGEMPQEIIIIDSTDVVPEVSIVQKGRSKSVGRLPEKTYSASREEKDEATVATKGTRAKSASVDEDLIKVVAGTRHEKVRPKSLGISKSLGSTEKKDSTEKISPKRTMAARTGSKSETKSADQSRTPVGSSKDSVRQESKVSRTKSEAKVDVVPQDLTQSPTVVLRKSGQTPVLFARARLGLSEGSGIGALQRQGATQSPTSQRRAKSLDAPVIAVHRLPPANAFSSKDDTVDVSESREEDQEYRSADIREMIGLEAETPSANFASKPQSSVPFEASPNHRSDSTDHTTVPEIFTDSLSVTETSAQYLESPLTECNEIIATTVDLIPYERDTAGTEYVDSNGKEPSITLENAKVDDGTKFIDQSSVESGAEQEVAFERTVRAEKIDMLSVSRTLEGSVPQTTTTTTTTTTTITLESTTTENEQEYVDETEDRGHSVELEEKPSMERGEDLPDVTVIVSAARDDEGTYGRPIDFDENQDMVRSPIQISIEECSDDDVGDEDDDDDVVSGSDDQYDEEDYPEIRELDGDDNRPFDSGDTSEDTLDALDTQIRTRGGESDQSSPDYGVDRMDEKTLVEVELTPEYLEARRVDEADEEVEEEEELPEDEPAGETARQRIESPVNSGNRLSIDKKLRLSSERSRSEETNTWTPDREDPESSSCSIARPLGIGQIQPIVDRRELAVIRDARRSVASGRGAGSLEEENNGGSHPSGPRAEMSSTWKSFPLESSGSSSIEDGCWQPLDESNAVQSQSEDSNGQNEDSFQEDLADFPGTFVYPIGPDILASCGTFALTRTLSRISERSTTSEQDKSDLEDSFKPSSRSPSLDDESLMSSDHQPSLSSDPPSKLRAQTSEDWPSPPSSPVFDPPPRHLVSHVETYYTEIKPEEAVKVTVTDSTETPGRVDRDSDSSDDENRTLHDDLHSALLEDGQSSMSATTVDGTVEEVAVKPKSNSYITGSSHSEDTSMGLSMSEWSSSNNTVRQFCQYSGTKSDDNSLAELGASISSDWSGSTTVVPQQYYSPMTVEKSQSDTTTSDKSVTSMRPNSKCKTVDSPPSLTSTPPFPPPPPSPPLTPPPPSSPPPLASLDERRYSPYDEEAVPSSTEDGRRSRDEQLDEARRFIESQFDEQRRLAAASSRRYDDDQQQQLSRTSYADISPPRITLRNEFDEAVDEDDGDEEEFRVMSDDGDPPLPILEEEEEDDRLYDNVPAMKYSSADQIRLEVGRRGDSSEDMHEKYANLTTLGTRSQRRDDEWSFEDDRREEKEKVYVEKEKTTVTGSGSRFERGFSEPVDVSRYHHETRSTERPVIVPVRAKSTPYYSTTSLSGESTTSSPPMQIRTQIRTKTMPFPSSRSPQSEGDTSSSMDSPVHTPVRGQIGVRRRRRENLKRRHRVVVDLEVKDGQIVSSTDSSFDVASHDVDDDDDEDDEYSEAKDERRASRRQQQQQR
ncbi:FERM, RhoGEF and pleckstrin domain-containing protein 2 [Dufourea novaeangliae]|uniref:Moesin/ezrin/radixin homolog 1 n=1 Tax=Dufourea novaeangliae TaxID=178035 RepID=A0A154PTV5_DUFNO|nr:FERM, RhoGEF and pleckstrin domain-containing protein 2 [Dufourea novaeangliae]